MHDTHSPDGCGHRLGLQPEASLWPLLKHILLGWIIKTAKRIIAFKTNIFRTKAIHYECTSNPCAVRKCNTKMLYHLNDKLHTFLSDVKVNHCPDRAPHVHTACPVPLGSDVRVPQEENATASATERLPVIVRKWHWRLCCWWYMTYYHVWD